MITVKVDPQIVYYTSEECNQRSSAAVQRACERLRIHCGWNCVKVTCRDEVKQTCDSRQSVIITSTSQESLTEIYFIAKGRHVVISESQSSGNLYSPTITLSVELKTPTTGMFINKVVSEIIKHKENIILSHVACCLTAGCFANMSPVMKADSNDVSVLNVQSQIQNAFINDQCCTVSFLVEICLPHTEHKYNSGKLPRQGSRMIFNKAKSLISSLANSSGVDITVTGLSQGCVFYAPRRHTKFLINHLQSAGHKVVSEMPLKKPWCASNSYRAVTIELPKKMSNSGLGMEPPKSRSDEKFTELVPSDFVAAFMRPMVLLRSLPETESGEFFQEYSVTGHCTVGDLEVLSEFFDGRYAINEKRLHRSIGTVSSMSCGYPDSMLLFKCRKHRKLRPRPELVPEEGGRYSCIPTWPCIPLAVCILHKEWAVSRPVSTMEYSSELNGYQCSKSNTCQPTFATVRKTQKTSDTQELHLNGVPVKLSCNNQNNKSNERLFHIFEHLWDSRTGATQFPDEHVPVGRDKKRQLIPLYNRETDPHLFRMKKKSKIRMTPKPSGIPQLAIKATQQVVDIKEVFIKHLNHEEVVEHTCVNCCYGSETVRHSISVADVGTEGFDGFAIILRQTLNITIQYCKLTKRQWSIPQLSSLVRSTMGTREGPWIVSWDAFLIMSTLPVGSVSHAVGFMKRAGSALHSMPHTLEQHQEILRTLSNYADRKNSLFGELQGTPYLETTFHPACLPLSCCSLLLAGQSRPSQVYLMRAMWRDTQLNEGVQSRHVCKKLN